MTDISMHDKTSLKNAVYRIDVRQTVATMQMEIILKYTSESEVCDVELFAIRVLVEGKVLLGSRMVFEFKESCFKS